MKSLQLTHSSSLADRLAGRTEFWLAVAIPLGFVAGRGVAHAETPLIVVGTLGSMLLAAVVLWPEVVLMAWFVAILADGRWLTYHRAGPLYVTEALLALLALGVLVRWLVARDEPNSEGRRRALRFLMLLSIVMFIPALASLLIRTAAFDYASARASLLIMYVAFALIAASVTDLRHSYRKWFLVALSGPAIAFLLVATGQTGSEAATSTGAIRIASHSFVLAFAIAPIVLAAASREGLIRPLIAFAGAIPFIICLILVNHRSAWLAFVAAALVIFGRRVTPPIIVGGVAILACGFVLFTTTVARTSVLGEEVARARTVASTSDPNANYRLEFWKGVLAKSIESPLFGAGFDPYPADIVPPSTVDPDTDLPAPHNSFLAIGYRIGILPLFVLLVMLANLVRQGYRASVDRSDPRDRATCAALSAIVVYVGVVSAFNVFLEAPYAGPVFWTAVGLLAYAVFAEPFRSRLPATQ